MKVLLVARDFAPSKALEIFGSYLQSVNVSVMSLLGYGKSLDMTPERAHAALSKLVDKSDVVLTGMSSSEALAEPELFACEEAVLFKRPFGTYSDTYRGFRREWFHTPKIASNMSFHFALNETDAAEAQK